VSTPYIVIEFPDGQRVAQRVRLGTTLPELEELWQAAWEDYCPDTNQRIRVGLGHGHLWMNQECHTTAVAKLSTTWLGYRDAVLPKYEDESVEPTQLGLFPGVPE
jgi:hypothetical protein